MTTTHTTAMDTEALADSVREIVCAYVAHNAVPMAELPVLIQAVHGALLALSGSAGASTPGTETVEPVTPAQARKSVQPDGLISFIDGKSYKTLKRHLTANGLTPASYRAKFGLPADYPMVAPTYAAQRSALAKAIGLGVSGARAAAETDRQAA